MTELGQVKRAKRVRINANRLPSRQEQALLAIGIGERLREAREMACMSQQFAAKRLGYATSAKLSKIESGKHSVQIPLWVLKGAAQIYDVSLDYLLGTSDTMEPEDVRHTALREIQVGLATELERLRQRDALIIASMSNRITHIEACTKLLDQQSEEAAQALARVIELNGEAWDEVRGGNRLANAVGGVAATARTARARLKRFHCEAKALAGRAQLDLVFE
ncbi:MAG: helix-turn-helix domain-containing protein [Aeromonas sp.]